MNKQEFSKKIVSWGSWCTDVHDGKKDRYVKISKVQEFIEELDEPQKVKARLAKHWDEDLGDCLWWNFPVEEPPYCGTPLDDDFPKYKTHFTELHIPDEVEEEPKYYVNIGDLYLKEPLGDTSDFTISMTWNREYAYPFDSWNMAREHASELGGTVEKV